MKPLLSVKNGTILSIGNELLFQSKVTAVLGKAGGVHLKNGSNLWPSDWPPIKDSVHFGQHWEYSAQQTWPNLFVTYLLPLYNILNKLKSTPSIHLSVFPLLESSYSIKSVPGQ